MVIFSAELEDIVNNNTEKYVPNKEIENMLRGFNNKNKELEKVWNW